MSASDAEIAAILRTIDKIIFDPFVAEPMTCLMRCRAVLKRGANKVGTIYRKEGKNTLFVTSLKDDQAIIEKEICVEGLNVTALTDNVNQTEIFKNVDSFTEHLAPQLEKAGINVSEFNITLQDSGTRFSTTSENGQVVIAAFSFLMPTYFDLCCQYNEGNLVYYSKRTAGRLQHSGDVVSNNRLLHTLTLTGTDTNAVIAPFITGYQGTPLRRFEEHRPVVVVLDFTTKELIVVRIPLDKATVGESTLCAPLVGRLGDRGVIYWEVLTNACVGTGSVPNLTAASRQSLTRARLSSPDIATFKDSLAQREEVHSDPTIPILEPDTVPTEVDSDIENEVVCDKTLLVNSLDVDELMIDQILSFGGENVKDKFTNRLQFGTSVVMCTPDGNIDPKYHPKEAKLPSSEVILPCVTDGPFEGGVVLAAGTVTPVLKSFSRNDIFKQSSTIVSVVGTKVTDAAREANPHSRINGVFIVAGPAVGTDVTVNDHLLKLNINAATALAGPRSLILAFLPCKQKFYTMDGVGIPGLLQGPIEPLKECTSEFISNFSNWLEGEKETHYSGVIDIRTAKVVFMEEEHTRKSLHDLFESVSVQDLVDNKSDVMDALGQLRRIFDNNDLKQFASKLIPTIRQKMIPKYQLTNDESSHLDDLFSGQMKKTDTYMKATSEKNKNKKALRWFVDALGALVSTKRSGTVGFSIQNLAKQQKVQANLQAALKMDREDFAELVSEHCSELGSIIMNVDKQKLNEGLKHIKSETLTTANPPFSFDVDEVERSRVLDTSSTLSLMDLTESWNNHPLSRRPGSEAIPLGVPISKELPNQSAMTFFLLDKFIDTQDPFATSWYSLADWQPVAVLRVLMRGTVTNCCETRDLGKLEPASKHTGYLLIQLYLQQIRQLAIIQNSDDDEFDFNNSNCQIQRSLFGSLLCLMSSGSGEPLCSAFHLLGKEKVPAIPKEHDWGIYADIAKYFKYTGWPAYQLKYNTAWLLVHWLNVKLATSVLDAVRGETKGGKDLTTGQKILKRGQILLLGRPEAKQQTTSRNRQRVAMIWGTDVSEINEQLTGNKQTAEEQTRGGYWFDEKHNTTFLSSPLAVYKRNIKKSLPFADAVIITCNGKDGNVWDKKDICELLYYTKNLLVTYTDGESPNSETESAIRKDLVAIFKKFNKTKMAEEMQIIHKSLLTRERVDSAFEELKTIQYNGNDPLRAVTYRSFKVKGVGYVFAVKIESGSISVGQELSFSKAVSKGSANSSKKQTVCTVKSMKTFPGMNTTEAMPGDFVSICVSVTNNVIPLRGAIVVSATADTIFRSVDQIDIVVHSLTKNSWVRKGSNIVCYSSGSLCTLVVENVKDTSAPNSKVFTCSTMYNGINATFEADQTSLCKVLLLSGSGHHLVGKVQGIPGSAKCETFKVEKKQEVISKEHARVSLPPSFSNPILGSVLQQVVTTEPVLRLIEDGIFTSTHASRVAKAVASCKPPPVEALKTLCCDSGLGIEPNEVSSTMLQFLEELMKVDCAEEVEHKILKRLLGSP